MKVYRQGDVLIVEVSSFKAEKDVPLEDGRIVLAHGEVTGHAHAIKVDRKNPKAKLWSADAERFLQVMQTVTLRHEEHAPVTIPPGNYHIAIQTEYMPEEIRSVAD